MFTVQIVTEKHNKKRKLTPIYISEKNLVSRQFTYTCKNNKIVFIKKWHMHIEIVLMATARNSFVFVSQISKKKQIIFWYHDFLGMCEKLHRQK